MAEQAINQTLLELRNQNALLRQANLDEKAAAKARADAEAVTRAKREWVADEAQKIEKCEGLPAPSMRTWLRSVEGAMGRTLQVDANVADRERLQAEVDYELGKKLMGRTARGELIVEVDKVVQQNPNSTTIELLAMLETSFLGADEPAAKRSELEELRQPGGAKAEHQVPAYCRKFAQKADEAYGVINRGEEVEEKLAEVFITSL